MSSGQAAASWQAVRSTHSPIRPSMPVSSAIGMNLVGGIWPSSGLCQRSSASKLLISQRLGVDHRLVGEAELARVHRAVQRQLDLAALLGAGVEAGLVEADVVAAAVLGPIEREIGVADHLLDAVAVARADRDADAGADEQPLLAIEERAPAAR